MTHKMKLSPDEMESLRSGSKSYELRLYDDFHSSLRVGDNIQFSNTQNPRDRISARILQLLVSKNFTELFKKMPAALCGCGFNPTGTSAEELDTIYPMSEQEKWGVVGIRLEVL